MNPSKHERPKYDDDDDDDDSDGKPAATAATATATDTTEDRTTMEEKTTAAMDVEQEPAHSSADHTSKRFVYVAVNGYKSQITKIEVKKGDMVIFIRDAIKEKGKNAFDSVAVFAIQLFRSKERSVPFNDGNLLEAAAEPLNPLEKWNSDVTWGTAKQPLIVYTPQNINRGESTSCGCQVILCIPNI